MSRGAAARNYAPTRDGHAVLVVRAAPAIDPHLFDVAQVVPAQLPRREPLALRGPRAFAAALLESALRDAELLPRARWRPVPDARRVAARRWLAGELEAEVPVPVGWLCDVLGLDAAALAHAVRRRA